MTLISIIYKDIVRNKIERPASFTCKNPKQVILLINQILQHVKRVHIMNELSLFQYDRVSMILKYQYSMTCQQNKGGK